MVSAWRMVRTKYAEEAFTGEGARRRGSRWTSAGRRVAFAASTASLAVLETLVHLEEPGFLESFSLIEVQFDESLVVRLTAGELPPGWRSHPAPEQAQAVGDAWLDVRASVALAVPSVIVEIESNFLLNPGHPAFARVQIGRPQPFKFDPRLR